MRTRSGHNARNGWPGAAAWLARLALAIAALLAATGLSSAEDTERHEVTQMRVAGDAARARLVLQLDGEPGVKWFLLRNPHRLVIDLARTGFALDEAPEPRGMLTDLQYGNLDASVSRLILDADGPFVVEDLRVLENESSPGFRLVADLVAGSEERFAEALADQVETSGATTATTSKDDRLVRSDNDRSERFTIVLDAGHGGIDTGARGVSGTPEKTITLAFALELKAALEDEGRYDVHLTRQRDVFLTLDERVRIARQHEADLFISVHADAIRHKNMRGATVYTVADRASDAAAAAKAIRENLADKEAGIEAPEENQRVADILVDLTRRETQSFSLRFARTLVGRLSSAVEMVNNPHRFAGFKVLRAPDVPSVLLELGYLSNAGDEKQLRDPEWRRSAIASIMEAISAFSEGRTANADG